MQIATSTQGAWTILTLAGKIDNAGADVLKATLFPHLTGGNVALDFTAVEYVTSAGFRVLMQADREQRGKQGRLVLGNLSEPVRHFFDIAGLSVVLGITMDLRAIIAGTA